MPETLTPQTLRNGEVSSTGSALADGNFAQVTRTRTLKRFNRLTKHLYTLAADTSQQPPAVKIAAYKAIGEYAIKPIIAELNAIRASKQQAKRNQSSTTVSLAVTNLPVGHKAVIQIENDKQHYVATPDTCVTVDIPGQDTTPPGEAAERSLPVLTDVPQHPHFSASMIQVPEIIHPVKSDAEIRKDVQRAIENEMFNEKGRPYKVTAQGIKKLLPLIEDGVRKCWECRKPIASITGNACICKTCKFKLDKLRKERYKAAKNS